MSTYLVPSHFASLEAALFALPDDAARIAMNHIDAVVDVDYASPREATKALAQAIGHAVNEMPPSAKAALEAAIQRYGILEILRAELGVL